MCVLRVSWLIILFEGQNWIKELSSKFSGKKRISIWKSIIPRDRKSQSNRLWQRWLCLDVEFMKYSSFDSIVYPQVTVLLNFCAECAVGRSFWVVFCVLGLSILPILFRRGLSFEQKIIYKNRKSKTGIKLLSLGCSILCDLNLIFMAKWDRRLLLGGW